MAKKKRSAKRGGSKRKKRPATVTVRFANEGHMAKKRRNPRKHHRRYAKGAHKRGRRRRNPSGFMERAGRLLGLAAVAVGTGVGVTYAASKIMPGTNTSLYGIPILTFLAGVAISTKMPTLGVGVAAGAAAPFVVPLSTKLLTATAPSTPATTAAGISRAYRSMRAIDMGGRMGAIDMGAVYMPYR